MTTGPRQRTRREFLQDSTAATTGMALGLHLLGTPAARAARSANEKVRVGFIGVGNRGTQLLHGFMAQNDVDVVALCDVYEPYLTRSHADISKSILDSIGGRAPKMGETFPGQVAKYKDFRRVLDRDDIDAVVIATPDHWHAVQTIMACQAGKDVYVEKPLSVTVREGREMVEAAKKHNRIVQVGLHRRSSQMYADLATQVQAGKIGKVTVARAYRVSNMAPAGIGRYPDKTPPPDLDWDMWLGPAPFAPYTKDRVHFNFRWIWDYSGGIICDWGTHLFDTAQWANDTERSGPVEIEGTGTHWEGGLYNTVKDYDVTYRYANGVTMTCKPGNPSIKFIGTAGWVGNTGRGRGPGKFGHFTVSTLPIAPFWIKSLPKLLIATDRCCVPTWKTV